MGLWSKVLMLSLVFFLLQLSIISVIASDANEVSGVFIQTEEVLNSAFTAVLDAEQAGAKVSVLLYQLNQAGDYLSEAYFWYHLGDSEAANHFSGLCAEAAQSIRDEAISLKVEADRLGNADFVGNLVLSGIGVVVISVAGLLLWRVFKRYYLGRVLNLRPEVVSNDS
jgi:hypothetical protein